MTEAVVLKFRATKHFRKKIKETVDELYRQGGVDSESMSSYIRQAVKEKLDADRRLITGRIPSANITS